MAPSPPDPCTDPSNGKVSREGLPQNFLSSSHLHLAYLLTPHIFFSSVIYLLTSDYQGISFPSHFFHSQPSSLLSPQQWSGPLCVPVSGALFQCALWWWVKKFLRRDTVVFVSYMESSVLRNIESLLLHLVPG